MSGRLVRWYSSVTMQPLSISRPVSARNFVAGRMPAARMTISAGRVPVPVCTPVTLSVPAIRCKAVPVRMRMPFACSFLLT